MKLFSFFKSFRRKRTVVIYPTGQHHDLNDIFRRVNDEYFEGKLNLKISWFNRRFTGRPRRVVLGSYHFRSELIRINSYLDQAHIPGYFVEYIVYHEALHHVLPPVRGKGGKRSIHHPEFKALEKKFKHYAQVKEFSKVIKKNLFES